MNLLAVIRSILLSLNSEAQAFIYEESRDENEALNYETPVIIIFPDWTSDNSFSTGAEVLTDRVYNIDFKTQDEFDNSDGDQDNSYNDISSCDLIAEMEVLANSVFWNMHANKTLYNIEKIVSWTSPEPILRENSGTMTGVRIRLAIKTKGQIVCNYE